MVMSVFTLPWLDVVFKVIRDRFRPPKQTTRQEVMEQYRHVFQHDRAGRLVDAQEFEQLAFPTGRASRPEVLADLGAECGEGVRVLEDRVAIRHLYAERRVTPLNLFVREQDEWTARRAVLDFGQALRDLAATNTFPGDLLTKNFGVTRHGRVIFYDYDELACVTECNFRDLPSAGDDEETAGEPWFYVGEQRRLPRGVPAVPGLSRHGCAETFREVHGELLAAGWWRRMQERLRAGGDRRHLPVPGGTAAASRVVRHLPGRLHPPHGRDHVRYRPGVGAGNGLVPAQPLQLRPPPRTNSCASGPPSTYMARRRSSGSSSSAFTRSCTGQAERACRNSTQPRPSTPTAATEERLGEGAQTFLRSHDTIRMDWMHGPVGARDGVEVVAVPIDHLDHGKPGLERIEDQGRAVARDVPLVDVVAGPHQRDGGPVVLLVHAGVDGRRGPGLVGPPPRRERHALSGGRGVEEPQLEDARVDADHGDLPVPGRARRAVEEPQLQAGLENPPSGSGGRRSCGEQGDDQRCDGHAAILGPARTHDKPCLNVPKGLP